jgi:predicted O-methyltransferase YrrM
MPPRLLDLTPRLFDYVLANSVREPPALRALREESGQLPGAGMQIGPEQGQLLALLAKMIGAKRCLEIGTFTGYSTLWVALALPEDGRIIACDINERSSAVARRHWQAAGMAGKIELRLAPATETLDGLLAGGEAGRYDFAFIDADKENYDAYYERVLVLLRPGGVLLIDNVLWGGEVADPKAKDSSTVALRMLNAKLHQDERIDLSLLAIGDGVTLARKR